MFSSLKLGCGVLLMAAVSGCQSGQPIEGPPVKSSIRHISGYQILSKNEHPVRTYTRDANGKKSEIIGMTCHLKSQHFTATVTTPKMVTVPSFVAGERFKNGGRPAPLKVTCRGNGKSGVLTVNAGQGRLGAPTNYVSTDAQYTVYAVGAVPGVETSLPWVYPSLYVTVE